MVSQDIPGNVQVTAITSTFTFIMGGVSHTVALVATRTVNAGGTTTIQFNLAASVLNASQLGALVGIGL